MKENDDAMVNTAFTRERLHEECRVWGTEGWSPIFQRANNARPRKIPASQGILLSQKATTASLKAKERLTNILVVHGPPNVTLLVPAAVYGTACLRSAAHRGGGGWMNGHDWDPRAYFLTRQKEATRSRVEKNLSTT